MLPLVRLVPVLVLAFIGVSALSALSARPAGAEGEKVHGPILPDHVVVRQIRHYQQQTWRWQALMGVRRTPATHAGVKAPSRAFTLWVRNLWHRRAASAWKRASNPPHRSAWLCIQRHEGAWADPNPPYYGGLQMDISFQRAHGPELLRRKGTADNWTPLEQMWVAERAHRSGRGFYPWPNTSRSCGLI
ncbi:MAG TPA: hypothetical protein VFL41_02495 [Gaiellaceae bacterium]|nr:hypothetical protein [Gaiellaceae bacterium]